MLHQGAQGKRAATHRLGSPIALYDALLGSPAAIYKRRGVQQRGSPTARKPKTSGIAERQKGVTVIVLAEILKEDKSKGGGIKCESTTPSYAQRNAITGSAIPQRTSLTGLNGVHARF